MLRLACLLAVLATPAAADDLDAVGRIARHAEDRPPNCTATLVSPRKVLTARHCSGAGDARAQRFFVGWGADGSRDTLKVVGARRGARPALPGDFASDFALMELDRSPDIAPLALTAAPEPGQTVRVISYPWAQGFARRDRTCRITLRDTRFLLLDCPAQGGMSGAPVLVETGEGWAVAGLVVARVGGSETLALRLDALDLDP